MENIIVIGTGDMKDIKTALHNARHDNVVIITPEEAKGLSLPEIKPIAITNPHPVGGYFIGEKQFICKGKHEYREVRTKVQDGDGIFIKVDWVCQCGQKL